MEREPGYKIGMTAIAGIFCILLLAGCGGKGTIRDDNTGTEITYEVDKDKEEIRTTDGTVYKYAEDEDGVRFQYPDGTSAVVFGDMDSMAVSDENEISGKYIQPDTLYEIYLNPGKTNIDPVGILLCIVGVLMLLVPHMIWYVDIGWKGKIEKNELALRIIRIAGILVIIGGIYNMF